ncbi:MAG: PHP domain-containing protein [Ruminococcaceae bacterium]|nr:PHP domain-containing protein [Oscillospiraceae bacterium]
MSFKTELHCHCGLVSACGRLSPERIVERYLEKGYTSLVITDHLSRDTFSAGNYLGADDWNAKIDFYMRSLEALEKAADGKLHILQGSEIRIDKHHAADYLIYGLDEAFLRSHTNLYSYHLKMLSETVRGAGGLFIQAHPFRNHMVVTVPELLDGVEVYNGTHTHSPFRNEIATLWADHYGMIKTSGSDLHSDKMFITGGIETKTPITCNAELIATLKGGNYTLLRNDSIFADSLDK